jgi:hypothetical protein
METCRFCGQQLLPTYGYSKKILILGHCPDEMDIEQKKPFAKTIHILRREFSILGVDLLQLKLSYFWRHLPNDNNDCLQYNQELCMQEIQYKQAVLLVGNTVEFFTSYSAKEVNGLQVNSHLVSAPLFAMVNPTIGLTDTIGEVRFAIQSFVKFLKEENLI